MSKIINASMTSSIQADVTTLACCVEIRRKDGRIFRVTDHNVDLTIGFGTFDASIAFELGPIDTGSNMAVDNLEMTLACDGTKFVLDHFKKRLFDGAEVTVFMVDWTQPSAGSLITRKGWISTCDYSQSSKVGLSIVGLMKLMDYPVARVYSPLCNATFGDSRCKIATNWSQAYATGQEYVVGDSFYSYDKSAMTSVTITNPGFEADGTRTTSQAITGWTKAPNAFWEVDFGNPYSGAYTLYAVGNGGTNDDLHVSGLYQDIDIGTAAGTTDIDDGKITFALWYRVRQYENLLGQFKVSLEMFDANGETIQYLDRGWRELDVTSTWRAQSDIIPLVAGVRTIRIFIQATKINDTRPRVQFDAFEAYYYDHTTLSPHSDKIQVFKTKVDYKDSNSPVGVFASIPYTANPGFEADGAVAYGVQTSFTNITDWEFLLGPSWEVTGSKFGLAAPAGLYFLAGGNVGTSCNILRFLELTSVSSEITIAKIDANEQLLNVNILYAHGTGNNSMELQVDIQWWDEFSGGANLISTVDILPRAVYWTGSPTWQRVTKTVRIPATARAMTMTAQAFSVVGTEKPCGFDEFFVTTQPLSDPAYANQEANIPGGTTPAGIVGTSTLPDTIQSFGTNVGDITEDAGMIFEAQQHHNAFATVGTVTSNKEVIVTTTELTLNDEYYLGSLVKWLSGNNAGQQSIVRIWDLSTETLKFYNETPFDIQAGDRFQITTNCLKRFNEDCVVKFGNQLNFRGFPYVPGRLAQEGQVSIITTQST